MLRPTIAARRPAPGLAEDDAGPLIADREQLAALIASTGASRVYLTGRCGDDVAAWLGDRARALAPPRQMDLFGEVLG